MASYGGKSGNKRFVTVGDLISQLYWVTLTEACQETFITSIIFIMREDFAAFLNSPTLNSNKIV